MRYYAISSVDETPTNITEIFLELLINKGSYSIFTVQFQ